MNRLSLLDQFITQADSVLRTLSNSHSSTRPTPARAVDETDMTEQEKSHSAGLMRVNHTGEVCAQALYQGQALTAKLGETRQEMQEAATEEVDHLHWCRERLDELGSRPSLLNGLWYTGAFAMGAAAGLAGDKTSLGFVAETEKQVGAHLQSHLGKLPANDQKSRAIIEAMIIDEAKHADNAMHLGGRELPAPIRLAMKGISKIMTTTAYRI